VLEENEDAEVISLPLFPFFSCGPDDKSGPQ